MIPPKLLGAAYDFSSAPESVCLLEGSVVFKLGATSYCGDAVVSLQFLPNARVVIHAKIQGATETGLFQFLSGRTRDLSLSFNGQKIDGFPGKWKANDDTFELTWIPAIEPVAMSDMGAKTSVTAIFHLFNFPDFRGGQYQTAAPAAFVLLEFNGWRVSVQELSNGATREAWNRIKAGGGCFLTHVVKLERIDGEPFSGREASEQSHLLNTFLSFIKGGKCPVVCGVGLDAAGTKMWNTFASPNATNPPYSWFTPFKASQAELLFPLFAQRWQESEEWKDCLRSAVYWYLQANTSGGVPGIDAAIILAQSALERLAHHYLVVDKKMISPEGFDRLKASDCLRLLFSSLSLPVEIGAATPALHKVAAKFKWADAPHALTDIRNELVHPVRKKEVADCFVDAWKLSLWYVELCVLALCGYSGTYTSRLTAVYSTQSEKVPWKKL